MHVEFKVYMEIEPDIDVFVGNSVDVDFGIFQLWLQQVEGKCWLVVKHLCCEIVIV